MAEIIYSALKNEWEYRQMLRSPHVDYFNGLFFVTFQVFHNKSVFGAVVGEECVLNELGEAVRAAWLAEPSHVAGLKIFEFVVMPNHFHAILEYHSPARGDRATEPGRSAVNQGETMACTSAGRGGPAATAGLSVVNQGETMACTSAGRGGPAATAPGRCTAIAI